MFVGNGGVNLISSFHIVGEIFDTVYPEGAIGSDVHKNIQTTLVPAGGASMVEFGLEVPGRYVLVDHALARMDRGAWGTLEVSGDKNPSIFEFYLIFHFFSGFCIVKAFEARNKFGRIF